jgi:hypothetical protein
MSQRDYDLTRRAKVGTKHRYACTDVVNVLDDAGRAGRRERRTAELSEQIFGLSSDGSPLVRWAFTAFTYDVEVNHAKDPYALPASVVSFWDGAPEDARPPSGKIVFEGAPENSDDFYPDAEAFGLSKTSAVAFMTAELVIHTRAFSLLATRTNGGVDQLRRVGDTMRMPWSGRIDRVRYASMFDARVHRGENTLRFEAVTNRHNRDVALLTCSTPYDVLAPGWGPTHVEFVGHLWIDLASGWLAAGDAHQTNYMSGVPMADGTAVPIKARFESSIELIPD